MALRKPNPKVFKGRKPALLSMKSKHPHLVAKRKPEAWPAQRPGWPDQITKPVQRPGRPDPMGRPIQRPLRPDPVGRPVQREVKEPIMAVRRRPPKSERRLQLKASQRELRPELVPKPIKKAVKSEPLTKPLQRAVRPESMTKAPQRKVQPSPVVPREVKTAPVAKLEVKPVAKTVTPAEKVVQVKAPETPKNPEPVAKKVVKSPPAAEKARNGDIELTAFMTRMLDNELKNLMDKVLQELADNASMEDIESGVAGMLQNQVVPDLRDVLGLNLTKRLLNVYNPFNVKVKFNGKPEKEELREFLKKYNFIGFVREAVNIFAAQVKGIDDFDKLCKEKEVKCGNVKVTINPVYSFSTCPPNLITKYVDINLNGITIDTDKDTEINDSDKKNTAETSKVVDNSSTVQVKIEKTTPVKDNEANKAIEPNKPVLNNAVKEIKMETDPPVVAKTENITPTKPQTTITAPAKETPVKTETKGGVPLVSVNTEARVNPTKILVTPEKATNKVAQNRVLTTPTKPAAKVTPAKITQTVAKVTPTKPIATKAAPTKAAPTKAAPTKVALTKVAPTKMAPTKVAPTKSAQTKVAPTKFAPTKATQRKSKEPVEEDDYDELDDHDILALMSEGIVLDEYVGSDEE